MRARGVVDRVRRVVLRLVELHHASNLEDHTADDARRRDRLDGAVRLRRERKLRVVRYRIEPHHGLLRRGVDEAQTLDEESVGRDGRVTRVGRRHSAVGRSVTRVHRARVDLVRFLAEAIECGQRAAERKGGRGQERSEQRPRTHPCIVASCWATEARRRSNGWPRARRSCPARDRGRGSSASCYRSPAMHRALRFVSFVVCALGALAVRDRDARADSLTATPEATDPSMRSFTPERRNGAVLGVSGGLAFAGSSGYPNNVTLIGNPDYYTSSPLLVGWSGSAFLLGALNDYVNFGPFFNIATFESPAWKSTGWGIGFRGEFFPLVKLVPTLADTAIYSQIGFGTTELRPKGPYPTAEGSQSFLGIGLHHEFRIGRFLGGHGTWGPQLEYDVIRSDNA